MSTFWFGFTKESEKIPEPIYTFAIKETEEHDEQMSFERTAEIIGEELATQLRDKSAVGKSQRSYDKQYLRDWLKDSGWKKMPPAPVVPEEVILDTSRRYVEAFETLNGTEF